MPPFIPDTRNRQSHTDREQSLAAGAGATGLRRFLFGDGKLRNQEVSGGQCCEHWTHRRAARSQLMETGGFSDVTFLS